MTRSKPKPSPKPSPKPRSAQRRCPCHSGAPYAACCQPIHLGQRQPQAPSALMRARYAAYSLGLARFIIQTTHPDHPAYEADAARWADKLRAYGARTSFLGLVVEEEAIAQDGQRAWVRFAAKLEQRGADMSFVERSLFVRAQGGPWLYLDGELSAPDELDSPAPPEEG